jgi:hypothetical protein
MVFFERGYGSKTLEAAINIQAVDTFYIKAPTA